MAFSRRRPPPSSAVLLDFNTPNDDKTVKVLDDSALDHLVPQSLHGDEDGLRLGRLAAGACLMVGVTSLGLAAARFFLDPMPSYVGIVILLIALAAFCILFIFQRRPQPRLAGTALACVGMLGTNTMAFAEGGLFSEGLYWALFVPLVTALFAGVRGALALAALGTGCMAILYLMHLDGHDFGKGSAPAMAMALHFMGLIGALWFGAYIGGLFEGNRLAAMQAQKRSEAEAGRLKDEIIAVVSHELRTPLTAIRGGLALLASGRIATLDGKAKDLLSLAMRNTERLNVLVNDLLDLQRLEQDGVEYHLRHVLLADELQHAVQLNEPYAQRARINLVLADDLPSCGIEVDSGRLQQVLANLLSNAIKVSPAGGIVLVNAVIDDDWAKIEVADQGPGIPESAKDLIFQRFRQLDGSDKRDTPGSGLGLNIARQLARGMGGDVGFVSQPGQGTIFHVKLPRMDEQVATATIVAPRADA